MPFNELMRSAVREAQIMDEREAAHEPRQAFVTRTEGNGVWVRFGTEDATAPESWFVSTVVGVPPGTMGWVYPLAGGKGLFVVAGMIYPIRQRSSGLGIPGGNTVSTSGDYPFPNATITFTDLDPGRTYWLDWTIDWLAVSSTNNGQGRLCAEVEHAGGTTIMQPNTYNDFINERLWQTRGDAGSFMPTSSGEIIVSPLFTWAVGTTQFLNSYIRATLS